LFLKTSLETGWSDDSLIDWCCIYGVWFRLYGVYMVISQSSEHIVCVLCWLQPACRPLPRTASLVVSPATPAFASCVVAFLTAVACSCEHPASANVGTIHKHPAGRWRQSTRPIQTVNKILIQHSCLYRFNSSYCLLPESCYLFCLFMTLVKYTCDTHMNK
jgi:hypothetical protein